MADPSQTALAEPAPTGPPPRRPKFRIRFSKGGDLRLVSHHDLMHCFERMLRRAELPVATSQGFRPKPKIVFALSLALGIAGLNEVLELELTQELAEVELLARLRRHAPPGIGFHSVRRLLGKSSAQPRRLFYSLAIPRSPDPSQEEKLSTRELQARCEGLLASQHLWVERTRPHPRRFDLRPLLSELTFQKGRLQMSLAVSPHGTARPEEVAHLLGLDEILENGACFERNDLEMLDESSEQATPATEPTLTEPSPTEPSPFGELPSLRMTEETGSARKDARPSRPTPLFSGPLSFES